MEQIICTKGVLKSGFLLQKPRPRKSLRRICTIRADNYFPAERISRPGHGRGAGSWLGDKKGAVKAGIKEGEGVRVNCG